MANNEIKTNAEIYREQRKERLAKAAKKNKNSKGQKALRIIVKAICIILVAGVVLYGLGNIATKVFCLPQKVLTAAEYGDEKISVAEYNYYYLTLFNSIYSYASQIESQYGSGYGKYYTGFDLAVDPADQDYVGDEIEGVKTWADYFKVQAVEKAFMQITVYNDALKAKFELSEEDKEAMQTEIDEAMSTYEENAKKAGFSLNNYIAKIAGEGLNEKSLRELMEKDYIAQSYLQWYQEDAGESLTDAEVKDYYNENKNAYDQATLRLFSFSYAEPEDEESDDPVYTKAEAKKLADEFKGLATDETAFKKYAYEYAVPSQKDTFKEDSSTLAANIVHDNISTISEKLANWAFSDKRASGDITVIDIPDYEAYYVALVITPAAPDRGTAGADVRHLLVKAETTDEKGNALDADVVKKNLDEAKKEAEKLLKEWKDGDATEDTFSALVTKHTDDTASAETGGLYEDITSSSSYVPEFLDWALAEHKAGDTGIVKTDYGYHIMYFVGADETEKWESDVRSDVSAKALEDYTNGIYEGFEGKIERNEAVINYFVKANETRVASFTTPTTGAQTIS